MRWRPSLLSLLLMFCILPAPGTAQNKPLVRKDIGKWNVYCYHDPLFSLDACLVSTRVRHPDVSGSPSYSLSVHLSKATPRPIVNVSLSSTKDFGIVKTVTARIDQGTLFNIACEDGHCSLTPAHRQKFVSEIEVGSTVYALFSGYRNVVRVNIPVTDGAAAIEAARQFLNGIP